MPNNDEYEKNAGIMRMEIFDLLNNTSDPNLMVGGRPYRKMAVANFVISFIHDKYPTKINPNDIPQDEKNQLIIKYVSYMNTDKYTLWDFMTENLMMGYSNTITDPDKLKMHVDCMILRLKKIYPNAQGPEDIREDVLDRVSDDCTKDKQYTLSNDDMWNTVKTLVIGLLQQQPNPDSKLNLKDVKNIDMTANCFVTRLKARYPDLDNFEDIPEDVGKQTIYDCVADVNKNQITKDGKNKMSLGLVIGLSIGGLILLLLILYMLMHRV
jgi:hypothetical protein